MSGRNLGRMRLTGLALAIVLFVADQWSKYFVVEQLGLRQPGDQYELLPFLDRKSVV